MGVSISVQFNLIYFYVGQSLTADVLTANDVKQRFTNAQASGRGTTQRDKRVWPVLLNLLSS